MITETGLQDLMTTGLKTYFHDPFLTHDHIDTFVTQTASVTENVTQLLLATGVQEASEVRANYDRAFFNPRYGTLRAKVRLNSMDDVFAFFGFKKTLSAPAWHMDESHAGIMLYEGNVYAVTGGSLKNNPPDIVDYQVTPIADIDATRWLVYEIAYNSVRWYSLPYTVPYFDKNVLPGLKQGLIRKWSKPYVNGVVLPEDELHYIVFYLKNSVGSNKNLEVQHITYSEVYPD